MLNFSLVDLIIRLPAVVIALTVHEFSHAASAYLLGDHTARNYGRLSLNPARHLDPIGFLCLLFARFGWAKPVPVNPYNFRSVDERTGVMLSALAGPMSNIVMCFACSIVMFLIPARILSNSVWLQLFMLFLMTINANLAFFNLIPVPPLDGSKVLFGMLPSRYYYLSRYVEQYGFYILIFLIITNVPVMIIMPLSSGLIRMCDRVFPFLYKLTFLV